MITNANGKFLIRRLLGSRQAGALVRRHRWYNEQERWTELVAALLATKLKIGAAKLSPMLRQLQALDLLDVSAWCQTPTDFDGASSEEIVEQTIAIFEDHGLKPTDARAATKVIHETAHRLGEEYKGKVQVALRESGEQMLDALRTSLSLKSLSAEEAREALTLWLQNVLNLPLALNRPSLDRFGRTHGLTASRLIEAADALDLNVAALDDLVEDWALSQDKKNEPKGR